VDAWSAHGGDAGKTDTSVQDGTEANHSPDASANTWGQARVEKEEENQVCMCCVRDWRRVFGHRDRVMVQMVFVKGASCGCVHDDKLC
jgi:hypothetical protein